MRAPRRQSFSACAACKSQKKRCTPDCIMARHIPVERTQDFLDVSRVFGLSNVTKMYHSVSVEDRDAFMKSIIYEAQMRREYPVEGCLKVIHDLLSEVQARMDELDDIKGRIIHTNQKQRIELMIQLQQQLISHTQIPQFGGVNLSVPTSFDPNMVNREGGASSIHPSSLMIHSDVGPHLLNDSSIFAKEKCAACKIQKKKCTPDCIMARYFPISRAQEFQDVQRVFGCSNMIKMYNSVPVQSRDAFMETIVYEAKMRQKRPVEGCLKVIRELSMQIEAMKTELPIMKKQVEMQNVQVQITEVPLKQTPQFGGEILQPLLPTSFNPNTVNCGYDSSSSNSPSLNVHLDAQMVQSGAVVGPHILQDSSFP